LLSSIVFPAFGSRKVCTLRMFWSACIALAQTIGRRYEVQVSLLHADAALERLCAARCIGNEMMAICRDVSARDRALSGEMWLNRPAA
jgi:hypothetical protein